uniref:Uncharacterized protein n=1 Tax=Cacopsylla melanoneura TaxID=428564 RepID=A0A8D8ZNS9_9HEMI
MDLPLLLLLIMSIRIHALVPAYQYECRKIYNSFNANEYEVQQKARLNYLIVKNYPYPANGSERLELEAIKIGHKLGIADPSRDIIKASRIGNGEKNALPFVIRLRDRETKIKWLTEYRARQMWKFEPWFMNENLSKNTQILLQRTKAWAKKNNYSHVVTHDCKVYIQRYKNFPMFQVKSKTQLKEFELNPPHLKSFCSTQSDPLTTLNLNSTLLTSNHSVQLNLTHL